MMHFDAIGFGALNVDKLFKVNKIASVEEESFVIDFKMACGGSAANTIVGLARLGCKVGLVGKTASDSEGRMMLENLRRERVDTSGVTIVKRGRSGTAMGFVDERGERALYVDSGVNDTIKLEEIDKGYVFRSRYLHLTSFVGERSFQTQKKLVEILPRNVRLSFDPGELYANKGVALEPIMKKTFVLMPNLKELELLTGTTDYRRGAKTLLKKGVKIIAAKLGSIGCYLTDGMESHLIEPFKVKATDTTGAGDAFCTGFLYGLVSGKSLYECGRIGNFVASRCIMKMGARDGLPKLTDLMKNRLI
jgi:ribokinase